MDASFLRKGECHMTFGTSIMIFFLAIIALVAEIILFMVFGIGATFSGGLSALSGTAFFFVLLMVLTAATGILAPICALIEVIVKKKNVGVYTMVSILGLIFVGLIFVSTIGIRPNSDKLISGIQASKNGEQKKEVPFPHYWIKTRKANVRSGPSWKDSIIATLWQGNKMYCIEHQGEWYKIRLEKGKGNVGWVHSSLLSDIFIEPYQEKTDYLKNVVVRNVHVGMSVLDEQGVWGEIKNVSNRALKEVEITIYCLDKNGNSVFEKKYHPVAELSLFDDRDEPLKPNYSRKFGVNIDDAPTDWAKKVKVKITNIEFFEDRSQRKKILEQQKIETKKKEEEKRIAAEKENFKETKLYKVAKAIPAKDIDGNYNAYKELSELYPEKKLYQDKLKHYEAKLAEKRKNYWKKYKVKITKRPPGKKYKPKISKSNEIERDGRFIAYANGTVKDTKTGLMWAARDNGENINWKDAKRYCENYRDGDYTEWRMPTPDELAELYNKSKTTGHGWENYPIHVTKLIKITDLWVWASVTRGSEAALFDFLVGRRSWDTQSGSYYSRALPVRAGN